jgi:hypothetical protein
MKTALENYGTRTVGTLAEDSVFGYGAWRLSRQGHALWVGHTEFRLSLEVNCAGWGAFLAGVNDQCFSVYFSGKVRQTNRLLPVDCLPKGEVLPADQKFTLISVEAEIDESCLRLTNTLSGLQLGFSSDSERITYSSPMVGDNLELVGDVLKISKPIGRKPSVPMSSLGFELPNEVELAAPIAASPVELEESRDSNLAEEPAGDREVESTSAESLTLHSSLLGEICLPLPFSLKQKEETALLALAKYGRASSTELRKLVGGRRVDGMMSSLQERFLRHGLLVIEIDHSQAEKYYNFQYAKESLP